jgi:hypothetical protein
VPDEVVDDELSSMFTPRVWTDADARGVIPPGPLDPVRSGALLLR